MTALGFVFIPLTLFFFLRRPVYLLPLLIVASIFEAGSVLNAQIGSFEFGVLPFYFVEVFIFLSLIRVLFGPAKLLPEKISPMRSIVVLLCGFWAWCFVSAFVMPHLFAGIPVSIPREMDTQDFGPLQWNLSNLAQAGYLTLNVGTVLYALHVVRTPVHAQQLTKALYWATAIVVLIGLAQSVGAAMGLDFPYELINNNPGYAQGFEQDLGLIRRINSTFTEPSTAGSYLAAINCGLLAAFFAGKRGILWIFAITISLTTLFLTTSSTGFAAFAAGLCVLALYFNPLRTHKKSGKSSAVTWVIVFVIFGIVAAVLIFTPDLLDAVMAMTIEKTESYSFWARMAIELHSMQLVVNTYGLGVGLGGNRSSGLFPTMVSSVGVIGTALFSMFLYRMAKLFLGLSADSSIQLVFWGLFTLIIAEIVAIPDLNRPVLWAFLMIFCSQLSVYVLSHAMPEGAQKARISAPRRVLRPSPGIAPAN